MSFIEEINNVDINDPGSWPNSFRLLMGVLGVVIIIGLAYQFIVKDQLAKLDKYELKEVELKKEFIEKKELAINLEAYKAQMVEAENIFSVLKEQLPSETEIPDLLTDVTQKGVNRGLTFQEFQPKPHKSKDFYNEKPVQIVVSGKYHQLAHFISDIAALPRIVNVGNFDISAVKKRTKKKSSASEIEGNLRMSAVINTYYYEDVK